jgi:AAA+ ATPase superfamily predicted ATPase
MNVSNPFNPNSVVAPNLFAGRTRQVNDICNKLTQLKFDMPSSFFIYGERGIGKTALAKLINFISTLKDPDLHNLNILTSYYAVEKGQGISSVLQESVNNLTNQMDKTIVEEIGNKLGQLFKNGKFEIGAFGASVSVDKTSSESTNDITIKDQTVSILSNIVSAIKKNINNQYDGVLIIIDEIHNLKNISGAASILRNIATSLDVKGLGKVSFLLIGYKEDINNFFSEDPSSRRIFDCYELGTMPLSDAKEVLTKGFTAAGLKWDDIVLSKNIMVTGGYPHTIQLIGHNLVEENDDEIIDGKDWMEVILNTAIALQSKEFSSMYSFNKPLKERDKILIQLAEVDKPISRKELTNLLDNKNIYQYLPKLKELGAIKEDHDGNILLQSQLLKTSILFDKAVRKYYPPKQ